MKSKKPTESSDDATLALLTLLERLARDARDIRASDLRASRRASRFSSFLTANRCNIAVSIKISDLLFPSFSIVDALERILLALADCLAIALLCLASSLSALSLSRAVESRNAVESRSDDRSLPPLGAAATEFRNDPPLDPAESVATAPRRSRADTGTGVVVESPPPSDERASVDSGPPASSPRVAGPGRGGGGGALASGASSRLLSVVGRGDATGRGADDVLVAFAAFASRSFASRDVARPSRCSPVTAPGTSGVGGTA